MAPDFGLNHCTIAPEEISSAYQESKYVLFISCCVDRKGKVKWRKEAVVQSARKDEEVRGD